MAAAVYTPQIAYLKIRYIIPNKCFRPNILNFIGKETSMVYKSNTIFSTL